MHNQENSRSLGQKINQIVVHSPDTETMLQQIAQASGESFGVDCCLTIFIDKDTQPNQTGYWCKAEFMTVLQQLQLGELISLIPNQAQ